MAVGIIGADAPKAAVLDDVTIRRGDGDAVTHPPPFIMAPAVVVLEIELDGGRRNLLAGGFAAEALG